MKFIQAPLTSFVGQEQHEVSLEVDRIESFSGSMMQRSQPLVHVVMYSGQMHTCAISLPRFKALLAEAQRSAR